MSRGTQGVGGAVAGAARAEALEARRLFAAFGAGAGATAASLADADGTLVTVTLAGPGTGTLDAADDGRLRLSLRDTTAASSLTITTDAGGDGRAALGGVEVAGALRAFTAKTADLLGDLSATGAVRTLWLNAAPGNDEGGGGGGTIAAPSIGELRTNGDLAADVRVAGRVTAISVGGSASGLLVKAPRIDRFDVGGDLTDAKVLLFPSPADRGPTGLRRLSVGGAMRGSRVNALADVGSVTAGAMFDSDVVAGVRFEEVYPAAGVFEPVLPSEHYEVTGTSSRDTTVTTDKEFDFTGRYALGSLSVTAAVTDGGGFAFANSRVAAHRVGSVRLAGVQPQNNGRNFGVAGYHVSRVQRHFGGPDGPALTREEHPRTNYFVVRQLFEKLRFNPSTGTYASGVIVSSDGTYGGGTMTLGGTILPAAGVQVGTLTDHPTAATVWLNADRSYDARGVDGTVVARDATLAGLAVQLVGTPGTSLKIVSPASHPSGTSGGLYFLSTSVSPELRITTFRSLRYRDASGAELTLPSDAELVAQAGAAGATPELLTKDVRRVRDEPLLIGRRFDDEHGVRTVSLSPTLALRVTGGDGAELSGAGSDPLAALVGDPARLGGGSRRLSVTVHDGRTGLTASGLGDGGTAVLYVRNEIAIDAAGNTFAVPGRDELVSRLSGLGMPPGRHEELPQPQRTGRRNRPIP